MSHPRHGINPAASSLQAWQGPTTTPDWSLSEEACPYGAHRSSDWAIADGGPIVCGVCHPPACADEVLRRGEAGFAKVEANTRARELEVDTRAERRRLAIIEAQDRRRAAELQRLADRMTA